MRRVLELGLRWVFLEMHECLLDITRHGAIDGVGLIIPAESHAKVEGASPLFGDRVKRAKSVNEMLGMFPANIFNAKVIDNMGESNNPCMSMHQYPPVVHQQ
jgi:hypothetical protein